VPRDWRRRLDDGGVDLGGAALQLLLHLAQVLFVDWG
jgi:hypothetical protein